MAYVLPAGSTKAILVDKAFVKECQVLQDMQDSYGEATETDPIPLTEVPIDVFQDLLCFYQGTPLEAYPPPRLLVMVRAADYLHYERLITAAVDEIARLICYADPEHVEDMFGVSPLTDQDLENIAQENPYLLEN